MLLHVRWFTETGAFPVQFDVASVASTWLPLGIAFGATAVAVLLSRLRNDRTLLPGPLELGIESHDYQRLLSWMPLVIGLHAAIPLLVAGTERYLLVPNMPLSWSLAGGLIGLAQIAVALSFLYGFMTRAASVLLALVWAAGILLFGPFQPLEQALFLGIAFFLFASGRGPLAFDMAIGKLHRPIESLLPRAVPVLRILTGLSICVAAFTEKLWNAPMALAFLEDHPFNFFPAIGLDGITDLHFVLLIGTIELTFGALLISGTFIRVMILILWLPFNLTLPFLGWRELVGHLPIYGIMALLLIWGERRPATERALERGLEEREAEPMK
jgi:uncharacterized membrane protein YphA (DoxX/SURF4 family)